MARNFGRVKCPCGSQARFIPTPTGRRHHWKCPACGKHAAGDQESGKLLEGLGTPALHQQRQRLVQTLMDSPISSEQLRAHLKLKPWEMKITFLDEKQVHEAFDFLGGEPEPPKPPKVRCKFEKDGKHCKRYTDKESGYCWQHEKAMLLD